MRELKLHSSHSRRKAQCLRLPGHQLHAEAARMGHLLHVPIRLPVAAPK